MSKDYESSLHEKKISTFCEYYCTKSSCKILSTNGFQHFGKALDEVTA